jgi:arylsulfatase A-like enzyme
MRKRKLFIILSVVLIITATALLTRRLLPVSRRPNIVLIVADILRSDRLPFYGYDRIKTPFLSDLAARSILFQHAWSTAPWTAPARASIFTSLYPFQHGVMYNIGNARAFKKIVNKQIAFRIPDKALTSFWGKGDARLEGRVIFSHLAKYITSKTKGVTRQHVSRAVISGKWQTINSVFPTRQFLFNWQNDPLEKINWQKEEPFQAQRLKNLFLRFEANCNKLHQD